MQNVDMEKGHNFHGSLSVIRGPREFKNSHGRTKQKLQYSLFVAKITSIHTIMRFASCWLDILIRIYGSPNELKLKKNNKCNLFISQNAFKA